MLLRYKAYVLLKKLSGKILSFIFRVDENHCIVVDSVPSGAASVSVNINNCIVVENTR